MNGSNNIMEKFSVRQSMPKLGVTILVAALGCLLFVPTASALVGTPKSDLNDDGRTDFLDFSVMAEEWLDQGMPPGEPDCIKCSELYHHLLDPNDPNPDPNVILDYLGCILEMIVCYDWHLLDPNEKALLQGYHDLLVGEGLYATRGLFKSLRKVYDDGTKYIWDRTPEPVKKVANAVAEYIPEEVEEFENLLWKTAISGEEAATEMAQEACNQMQKTVMSTYKRITKYVPPEAYEAGKDAMETAQETTDEAMNVVGFRRN